jgi:hypothetical protein
VKINGASGSYGPGGSVVETELSFSYPGHGAVGGAELYLSALKFSKDLHLMGWARPKYLVKIVTDPS